VRPAGGGADTLPGSPAAVLFSLSGEEFTKEKRGAAPAVGAAIPGSLQK
jgi:hypothetical protein